MSERGALSPQLVKFFLGDGRAGERQDHWVLATPWPFYLSIPLSGNEHGFAEIVLVSACCHARTELAGTRNNRAVICASCHAYLGETGQLYFGADVGFTGVSLLRPKEIEFFLASYLHPFSVELARANLADFITAVTDLSLLHRPFSLRANRRFMGKLAKWYGEIDLISASLTRPTLAEIEAMGGRVSRIN